MKKKKKKKAKKKPRARSETYLKALGRRIKTLRESRGWTQTDLARRARMHVNIVFKLEHGVHDTTTYRIRHLAKALRVTTDYLLQP